MGGSLSNFFSFRAPSTTYYHKPEWDLPNPDDLEPKPGPSRCGLSQLEWIPEYNNRTPYNESEIVSLITELYELLVELGYTAEERIGWAPPQGQSINSTLCAEIGIKPAVVSLMQKLPYHKDTRDYWAFYLFPQSRAYRYVDDDHIRQGRDPINLDTINNPPRLDYVSAQDIALVSPGIHGTTITLDTDDNTIRVDSFVGLFFTKPGPLERPDDEQHYRNAIAAHAPTFLKNHIARLRSRDLIPTTPNRRLQEEMDFCDSHYHLNLHPVIKKVIMEEYGWPLNFRREDWLRDQEIVWDKAFEDLGESGLDP